MSAPVSIAVIGCGHLGRFHAKLYREMPEAQLICVVDLNEERAAAVGTEFDVPGRTDLAQALAEAEAWSIATPTSSHADVATAGLDAGKHVLIEKPITTTAEEGRALVALAQRRQRVLAVGQTERWNPAFRAALPSLRAPHFIESHRLAPFVERGLDVDVVLDLMIHDLDITLSLLRDPIRSIDAVGVPVLTAGEDIANARIRFESGAVANLTASRVSRERTRKIRFFGAQRYVSVDLLEAKVEEVILESIGIDAPLDPGGAPVSAEEMLMAELRSRGLRLRHGSVPVATGNALLEELRDFVRAVRGAPLEGASGADGLRNLEVALEVRRCVRDSLAALAARSREGA
ncbi:MAG: Gfo/Idh/MocA family oxidoreductase [Candidatus Eisenbacteria bacterium]|nr:Gfo/Idh/MocA family oxidoreductase [Candidatus Eisenbacteria bacterium]MCC7141247.1 Gfo/Idh/MocA family oxidoreductase [Candidatus Eisenbacteria bacterium]